MSQLRANNLAKQYKKRKVVNSVSIELNSGEIVGLLGPNGAGKTSSFYMIVGLVKADEGSIYLDERNITALPMHRRSRLGISYLPQEHSIFRKLSVEDNLLAVLELNAALTKEQRGMRLELLLNQFNLSHLRHEMAFHLSGGEQRRVEIARSLANQPKFLLLDEPFAGIDPISIADTKRLILQLRNQGIGVLITDHNVRETLDICERAYIVNEGKILLAGTPKEIINDAEVKKVYLGED